MATVADHYARHLAPVYAWTSGGMGAAIAQAAADLDALGVRAGPGDALDLGAGFGAHAIPLAQRGFRVTAVDSSDLLLDQLRSHPEAAAIATEARDIATLGRDSFRALDLVLCMGDTLTHLADQDEVVRLFAAIGHWLKPGGRFLATFRDYLQLPAGELRLIPVRSDGDRIHTCILEPRGREVIVHDLLHERAAHGWTSSVSSYAKLRLDPQWLCDRFAQLGLVATLQPASRGMVALTATMPAA